MSKPIYELKLVSKLPTTDINQEYCYCLTAIDGAKAIDTIWRYYSGAWHQVGTEGYTTENVANKVSVLTDATSTTKYTNVKAVVDGLATKMSAMASITGYNASATQTLKNVNGTLTWVTDAG